MIFKILLDLFRCMLKSSLMVNTCAWFSLHLAQNSSEFLKGTCRAFTSSGRLLSLSFVSLLFDTCLVGVQVIGLLPIVIGFYRHEIRRHSTSQEVRFTVSCKTVNQETTYRYE